MIKKVVLKGDEQTAEDFKIDWKEGKDVTKSSKRKKDADESTDSFFSWFTDDDATLADYIANQLFSEALQYVFLSISFANLEQSHPDDVIQTTNVRRCCVYLYLVCT